MITKDSNGRNHFSDITNRELFDRINIMIIDGLYPKLELTDQIHEEIHELFMRLTLANLKLEALGCDTINLYKKTW